MKLQRLIHKTATAEYNVQCHLQKKRGGDLDQVLLTLAGIGGTRIISAIREGIIRFKEMIRIVL
ncbi:hypothetical protein MOB71_16170 [Bacillus spizizenii]|nr:hypothetical protein [Bacillus spizizenii]KFI01563.1 hypothetical protein JN25_20305 [Bacillus sp. BSC154]QCJ17072.1 hypothetical protein FA024_07870 [Bacillus subtilis]EFG92863.1 hypothetical protein BSU6633_07786 [Bacillus spizizenii ATCC 6633 = JCM 2499]MBE0172997.1 hypothetical protein [Bacillus spizizenii]MCY7885900.1 hypothetical protein [Bacillus spizizenii]